MAETLGFYSSGCHLSADCVHYCLFSPAGGGNLYADPLYRSEAISFILCQIVVVFFSQSYQGILKRGYYGEFTKTVKHVGMVMLLSMAYLLLHSSQEIFPESFSLLQQAFIWLLPTL